MAQPEMSAEVLTDADMVNAILLDRVDYNTVFDNAYDDQDVSGVNNDEFNFYVDDGTYDTAEINFVDEGSAFPRRKGSERQVTVSRKKLGEEYGITMEAEMDSVPDEEAREAERKMDTLGRDIDRVAFTVLDAAITNNDLTNVGDAAGSPLTYADIVDANSSIRDAPDGQYAPDSLFVGNGGMGDILKMDEFTHATEAGDDVIRNGRVGTINGVANVYVTSNPQITLGSGEALMVDSRYFGREAQWLPPTVRRYQDPRRQVETVMQMYTLFGYTDTHANAANRIIS